MEIVPMSRRHLRSVLRIERKTPGAGWSLGLFLSELSRPENRIYMVAIDDGRVLGFCGLLVNGDEAHVTTIAVDPPSRARGVGSGLMLFLAQGAIASGVGALTLEVRASNVAALALYRKFGMAPVGVRKSYYTDPEEDALVLWSENIRTDAYHERLVEIEASLVTSSKSN